MGHYSKFLTFTILASFVSIAPFAKAQMHVENSSIYDPGEAVFSLSLDDVTQIALQNNFDIQLTKFDTEIKRTEEGVAESIYDTIIEAEFNYRKDKSARTNTFGGTESDETNYNLSASKKLPTGTTLTVDYLNNKTQSDSAFATINPAYDTSAGVTVKQELGKNFFGLSDRGDIKITRLDIENAEFTSLEKIEDDIAEVQKAYWNLKIEIARERVEKRMVEQAKKLYDLHQEKIQDGLIEEPEILASEANYRDRINEHLFIQNEVKTKQNILKFLLNIAQEDISVDPTDKFENIQGQQELSLSLKQAFDNRRDYKRAHNDIKSRKINLSMKKNNLWPEINLEASFERNGISDQYEQSFNRIGQEDNPDIFTGLTISFPLENTEAKSNFKAAKIEKAKALLTLKMVERRISVDIIDQVRTCNVLKEVAMNAREVVDLQNRKLKGEEKQFYRGRSDTDTIIRFQEDLLKAEDRALNTELRYLKSLIDLKQKEGTLLDSVWEEEI